MEPGDLMSIQEVAKMGNVGPSAINMWERRPYMEFPEPWGVWPGRIRLWLRVDIEQWYANRNANDEESRQIRIKRLKDEIKRLQERKK
jgi:hypothetical protein